ncbi:MAG: N-acetyltransferase [Thermoplasmata archaeon]
MKIRRLLATDWEAFRILRLNALGRDPLAFGSTLEREMAYPEERWKKWTESSARGDEEATFVAEPTQGYFLGMVGLFTDRAAYHLWGMWVTPEVRGQGIGRDLLDRVLSWAHSTSPNRPILLDVNPDQGVAVRLYESRGFRPTGQTTPLGHDAPAHVQEMAREPIGGPSDQRRRLPSTR